MGKQIVIAITGASGVVYGIRALECLQDANIETHLIISEAGKQNIALETAFTVDQVLALADHVYANKDLAAPLASGSFLTDGMCVVPCTIKTLSGIASCDTHNLIIRAADVALKEKRKLVLVVRETPLHLGHLRLMTQAAQNGAHLLPPMPSFYHAPRSIDDIIDQTVGKMFDFMGIPHALFKRWGNSKDH